MVERTLTQLVRFGVYEVDLRSGELRKNGLKLKLSGQPFQVLGLLLERPGELVTREEIQKRLWPADTFVDFDHNLNTAINKIREALGDSAENPRFVETLPRRGYRFIAPVDLGVPLVPALSPADGVPVPAERPQGVSLQRWPLRLAAVLAMLAVGAAVVWYVWQGSRPKPGLIERRLTANSSELAVRASAISPDGRYLAYSDDSGIHLKVIDTAETHDLPTPVDSRINKLGWFPDCHKLLASAEAGRPGVSSLWAVSILGGTPQKLRDDAADGSILRNGKGIVFVSGGGKEIWQMKPGGEEARKLITASERDFFFAPAVVEGRVWYARGHVSPAQAEYDFTDEYDFESRDLQGGPAAVLLSNFVTRSATPQALLLDGRVIYSRMDQADTDQGGSLWETRVDLRSGQAKSKPRKIADWPDFEILGLSATADGQRLAFVKEHTVASVYVADLEGNAFRIVDPRRLTLSDSEDHAYDWTSDSKSVLFDSNRSGTWDIYRHL